jgi:hypothetical protein
MARKFKAVNKYDQTGRLVAEYRSVSEVCEVNMIGTYTVYNSIKFGKEVKGYHYAYRDAQYQPHNMSMENKGSYNVPQKDSAPWEGVNGLFNIEGWLRVCDGKI